MAEQSQNNETRRAMLASIREHLKASAPFDAVHDEHQALHQAQPREITATVWANDQASLVERFQESLEAVVGHCIRVRNESEAAEAVREIIEQLNARRVAISNAPLVRRVMAQVKTDTEWLENASTKELFDCDAGVTSAQWAIAETGTLVLESDEERHRLASLVPPVHIAMIEAARIRQTLGEVLQRLDEKGRERLSRTVTFITGPSRTSDIELTLAIGVHGPRELHVIILEGLRDE
ncbi:MAG TPA: lactate utilization protein [Pyrinomonadaceae bacterium]